MRIAALHGRRDPATGPLVYADRFAPVGRPFAIPTLDETLTLIRGPSDSTDRTVGVYVEAKSPHWHRPQGRDLHSSIASDGVFTDFPDRTLELLIESGRR